MTFARKIVLAALSIMLVAPAVDAATPPKNAQTPTKRTGAQVKKPVYKHVQPIKKSTSATKPGAQKPVATTKPAGSLVWNSVTTGFALAKKTNKPILVDFFTDWCGWCKVMDEKTFHEPTISKVLASKFVLVKANAEDGADGEKLSKDLQIRGFPTTVLFEASGKPKQMLVGFVPPEKFSVKLDEFLTGKAAPVTSDAK